MQVPKTSVSTEVEVTNQYRQVPKQISLYFWSSIMYILAQYSAHSRYALSFFSLQVGFVIHNLPVIAKMAAVGKACGNMFQLQQGNSAETSGGLLICLPRYMNLSFLSILSILLIVPIFIYPIQSLYCLSINPYIYLLNQVSVICPFPQLSIFLCIC